MSDTEDMVAILRKQTSAFASTAERRARELRGVSPEDRRALRMQGPARTVQLNIRVTPRFKQRVSAYAVAHKLSVTEVLVRAFDALAAASQ